MKACIFYRFEDYQHAFNALYSLYCILDILNSDSMQCTKSSTIIVQSDFGLSLFTHILAQTKQIPAKIWPAQNYRQDETLTCDKSINVLHNNYIKNI